MILFSFDLILFQLRNILSLNFQFLMLYKQEINNGRQSYLLSWAEYKAHIVSTQTLNSDCSLCLVSCALCTEMAIWRTWMEICRNLLTEHAQLTMQQIYSLLSMEVMQKVCEEGIFSKHVGYCRRPINIRTGTGMGAIYIGELVSLDTFMP